MSYEQDVNDLAELRIAKLNGLTDITAHYWYSELVWVAECHNKTVQQVVLDIESTEIYRNYETA